ncbi:unnamed protein product [Didymodactylos carnosus]|uniref:Uncharacterized protein n=2 Tax=Didymodactylos carnosus TaxID=1234261 RepID=A0A8S2FRR7_9BILA|nr:unnamed protein product [Didymodactylos carnosus]CAF4326184.1 unnamed protein product [Didymodactylos carnosus]
MSSQCQIESCTRRAAAHCYCCKKGVCAKHFAEHDQHIKDTVHPLVDKMNILAEKLAKIEVTHLSEQPLQDLERWKNDCYALIEDVYSRKQVEIALTIQTNAELFEEYKSKQEKKLEQIRAEVEQLIQEEDATFSETEKIKAGLEQIETHLNELQTQFVSVKTRLPDKQLVTVTADLALKLSQLNISYNNGNNQEKGFGCAAFGTCATPGGQLAGPAFAASTGLGSSPMIVTNPFVYDPSKSIASGTPK